MIKTKKELNFESAGQMLDEILSDRDLYNIETGEYVFHYSEKDSIAVYTLSKQGVEKLYWLAKESGFYWGAYLGPGGYIYDNDNDENLEWCETHFKNKGWSYCDDTYVSNEVIIRFKNFHDITPEELLPEVFVIPKDKNAKEFLKELWEEHLEGVKKEAELNNDPLNKEKCYCEDDIAVITWMDGDFTVDYITEYEVLNDE